MKYYDEYVEMVDGTGKEAIYEYLNSDYYKVSNDLDPQNIIYHNPCLTTYQLNHNYTESGWDNTDDTSILSNAPEYLPSDRIIEYLTNLNGLVEVGAGNGYWSYVINQNGGDAMPTDISPKDLDFNILGIQKEDYLRNPSEYALSDEGIRKNKKYPHTTNNGNSIWSEVRLGNHTVVSKVEYDNVLLCHSPGSDWVLKLLDILESESKRLISIP